VAASRVEYAHLGLEVLVGSDSARASHQFGIAHSPQENPSGPGAPEPGWVSGSGAAEAGAPPLDVTEPARRVRTRPRVTTGSGAPAGPPVTPSAAPTGQPSASVPGAVGARAGRHC